MSSHGSGWTRLLALAVVTVVPLAGCGGGGASSTRGGHPTTTVATNRITSSSASVFTKPALPPTRTSCRTVVYIGDSTSEGEVSPDYIPNARRRLPAQLIKAGVNTVYREVSGARSIVETYQGIPNAATVAQRRVAEGFRGCWILALGTNDVANVEAGSGVGLETRIAHMMSTIGHRPVMWVNVITLLGASPYAEGGMRRWNHALLSACSRHPLMRVFDWARHAKHEWFLPDGIHYTSSGYVARSRMIAHGLIKAFPKGEPANPHCLIR